MFTAFFFKSKKFHLILTPLINKCKAYKDEELCRTKACAWLCLIENVNERLPEYTTRAMLPFFSYCFGIVDKSIGNLKNLDYKELFFFFTTLKSHNKRIRRNFYKSKTAKDHWIHQCWPHVQLTNPDRIWALLFACTQRRSHSTRRWFKKKTTIWWVLISIFNLMVRLI